MLAASHEALVDDLGGVVAACLDVDAFLDYRVAPCSQRLSGLVPAWLDLGWWGLLDTSVGCLGGHCVGDGGAGPRVGFIEIAKA